MCRDTVHGVGCFLFQKYRKSLLFLFLTLLLLANGFPSLAGKEAELSLYATSAVLLDGESGRVLYGKAENEPMPNASTTKVLTCILALENCELGETVTISDYAASMPKVKLGAMRGESYGVKQLLYSLMLESHNDSAVALAEHVGKRSVPALAQKEEKEFSKEESMQAVKAFADLMNQKAREITREPDYSFTANKRAFSFLNHNGFLSMMQGAISGKTGFTGKAGYCYVGALESEGRVFVVALLACGWPNNRTYKWKDTKTLMNYGLENFRRLDLRDDKILVQENILPEVRVLGGRGTEIDQLVSAKLRIQERTEAREGQTTSGVLLREGEELRTEILLPKELTAPVREGQILGEIRYVVGEELLQTECVIAAESVEKIDFAWCLKQVTRLYLGLGRKETWLKNWLQEKTSR
ncbi:MAG: serine hydrolase [Acetatifactor sp.]|nr:serine hydrolase [Acetatifactor sp.]